MCPTASSTSVGHTYPDPVMEAQMSTSRPTTPPLDDQPVPVRVKLAAAWTSFMFLYVYVDIIGFYKPGVVDSILDGKMWEFDVTQTLSTTVIALMAMPISMVVLSATLPARANRTVNLVVASLQIPFAAFNMAGGDWPYYYGLGVTLELALLVLILRWAWAWPRTAAGRQDVTGRPR
jgi:hypothetical protein